MNRRKPINRSTPEKIREWERRSKPLANGRPPKGKPSQLSRSPLARVGRKRRKQRSSGEVFGKLADRVRELPCCVCGAAGPSDPHHVRSRGAGWKDRLPDGTGNVAPLCRRHHTGSAGVHTLGPETFASRFEVDLSDIARSIGVDICQ